MISVGLVALVAAILGGLTKFLVPYIRKWYESGQELMFDYKYIVPFLIALIGQVLLTLTGFLAYDIPEGSALIVFLIVFGAFSGYQEYVSEILKFLKLIGQIEEKIE